MITEEEIEEFSTEPLSALAEICGRFLDTYHNTAEESDSENYQGYLQLFALATVLSEDLDSITTVPPKIAGTERDSLEQIDVYFSELKYELDGLATQIQLGKLTNRFKSHLGKQFCYEFSQGDLDKIQSLLNELRELIGSSTTFEDDHKRRLLSRLENLQGEMHKKVSDLDRFWGLVGDAGVAIGKLGKDSKPIVDRIKEITDVVWRTQSRAEELPSGTPLDLLSSPEETDA